MSVSAPETMAHGSATWRAEGALPRRIARVEVNQASAGIEFSDELD